MDRAGCVQTGITGRGIGFTRMRSARSISGCDFGAGRELSALNNADVVSKSASQHSTIDFANTTCIDSASFIWRFEMALAQLTSADASIGTIYVNPSNVVYVATAPKYTIIATTVPNSNGVPFLLYVADSVEQVKQKLNIAMGKIATPA
jgi:hypothetical protein